MIDHRIVGVLTGLCILLNLQLCAGELHAKCLLPLAEGNCSESIQSWYYNNKTGICQPFIYRGCNGNANNFNSTMYCYHACNVSVEAHSYSIPDKNIKSSAGDSSASAAAASNADENSGVNNAVTQPTAFPAPGPAAADNGPGILPTREPSLIRNPSADASGSQTRVPVKGAAAADTATGSQRTKRSTLSRRYRHHQVADRYQQDGDETEQPEESVANKEETSANIKQRYFTSKRRLRDAKSKSHSKVDVINEDDGEWEDDVDQKEGKRTEKTVADRKALDDLVSHMESTVSKLQKIAAIAKSAKRRISKPKLSADEEEIERDSEQKKLIEREDIIDEENKKAESDEARHEPPRRPRYTHRRPRYHHGKKSKAERKNRDKLVSSTSSLNGGKKVDFTVIGGNGIATSNGGRLPLAALLKLGLDLTPSNVNGGEDRDGVDGNSDDEIEVVGERIQTIIYDPSYVFSATNISTDDMISLREMVAQAEFGTMQMVEKSDDKATKQVVNKGSNTLKLSHVTSRKSSNAAPVATRPLGAADQTEDLSANIQAPATEQQ